MADDTVPSKTLDSSIIRDGDNVVLDANGYRTLITIKRGRCVMRLAQRLLLISSVGAQFPALMRRPPHAFIFEQPG